MGYLSKAKDFDSYFTGYTSVFLPDSITKNERIKAIELGYSYNSKMFTLNVNGYITKWENKPTNQVKSKLDDLNTYGDIPGMDALHKGVELDFIYKILKNLDFQGLVSLGDWRWDKKIENLQMYYTDTHLPANKISFDATGIHVGDAAQTQLGASLRYEPIKKLYIEGGGTFSTGIILISVLRRVQMQTETRSNRGRFLLTHSSTCMQVIALIWKQ
jgi:hypothetical protein